MTCATLIYRLYAGAWAVVRRLPERVAYRLFDLVADLVVAAAYGRRCVRLEANLRPGPAGVDAAELRALSRAGHALLPALLVRRVPAARLEPRPGRRRRVRVVGEELPARAAPATAAAAWSAP